MTAKEKAEGLVAKYYSEISGMKLSFLSKLIIKPIGDSHYETAKKCALIAVDEIEAEFTEFGQWSHELQNMEQEFRFLNLVREEIKKL